MWKLETIIPLGQWLDRRCNISERFYKENYKDYPTKDWLLFLHINEVEEFYKVRDMKWLSLDESIKQTEVYLTFVSDEIDWLEWWSLDNEEKLMIEENDFLPPPPISCTPLYFITVNDWSNEKIVYIGITKNSSRFSGGHAVGTKLNNPIYNNMVKKIYRCSIIYNTDKGYNFIEWIRPKTLAKQLLEDCESQLIHNFQPELNTNKIKKNNAKYNFDITIENCITDYLHQYNI